MFIGTWYGAEGAKILGWYGIWYASWYGKSGMLLIRALVGCKKTIGQADPEVVGKLDCGKGGKGGPLEESPERVMANPCH